MTVQWHKINKPRGRNAAGFALGPLRPLRGSRAPSCDFALQSSSLRSSGDLTASPQVHLALRQPDACRPRANGARPRNAAGLSCGVPPPERARQRVGQKVAWMLHPATSVTTRERPSPRAVAVTSQSAMPRVRCAAVRGRASAQIFSPTQRDLCYNANLDIGELSLRTTRSE